MRQDKLLHICKRLIETKAGLGSSELWTNREYEKLSYRILDDTDVKLSPYVLKQVWSKAKPLMPDDFTLNTLARYAGYKSWKIFALNVLSAKVVESEQPVDAYPERHFAFQVHPAMIWIAIMLMAIAIALWTNIT